jgi:molybdopterin-guanine dinucleotide biosynthesis protein A
MPRSNIKVGGIVLCGGRSTRMGVPKAWLPFGPETMLGRIVRIVREVVEPVVVVAAAGQNLPELPAGVRILRDEEPDLGPLGGLAVGLPALSRDAEAAYVTSCDVPLLSAAFIQRMIDELGAHELVIPRDGDYHHPLAAVYRTGLAERVRRLVAERRLRPVYLLDEADARIVEVDALRDADPGLASLRNVNRPEDYHAALAAAGLPVPENTALGGRGDAPV